jgi:hypothetical protein
MNQAIHPQGHDGHTPEARALALPFYPSSATAPSPTTPSRAPSAAQPHFCDLARGCHALKPRATHDEPKQGREQGREGGRERARARGRWDMVGGAGGRRPVRRPHRPPACWASAPGWVRDRSTASPSWAPRPAAPGCRRGRVGNAAVSQRGTHKVALC